MKKILIVLLVCMHAIVMLGQEVSSFELKGQLTGFADSVPVRLFRSGENAPFLTTTLLKQQFILRGQLTEPTLVFLFVGDQQQPAELFLEQTSVVVKGEKGNPMNWVVTGSQTNQIFRDFVARFMPYVQLRNNQATALNDTGLGAKRDSVMQEYVMANTKMQEQIDNLVKMYPASPVTPFVLAATYGFKKASLYSSIFFFRVLVLFLAFRSSFLCNILTAPSAPITAISADGHAITLS